VERRFSVSVGYIGIESRLEQPGYCVIAAASDRPRQHPVIVFAERRSNVRRSRKQAAQFSLIAVYASGYDPIYIGYCSVIYASTAKYLGRRTMSIADRGAVRVPPNRER